MNKYEQEIESLKTSIIKSRSRIKKCNKNTVLLYELEKVCWRLPSIASVKEALEIRAIQSRIIKLLDSLGHSWASPFNYKEELLHSRNNKSEGTILKLIPKTEKGSMLVKDLGERWKVIYVSEETLFTKQVLFIKNIDTATDEICLKIHKSENEDFNYEIIK